MAINLKKIRVREADDFPESEDAIKLPLSRPRLNLDHKQVREIKNWEKGRKYRMVVELEMTGKDENEFGTFGSFDVTAYKDISPVRDEHGAPVDDDEFERELGEGLAANE